MDNKTKTKVKNMTLESIMKFREICKHLEIKIDKESDNFDKRLILQKAFYFLKQLGINLDIKYNFYKFGPYSTDLTDYYYSVMDYGDEQLTKMHEISLSEIEKDKIIQVDKIVKKWEDKLEFLELLASLLYIKKDMYIKERAEENFKRILKTLKSDIYTENNYNKANKILIKEGLI